MKAVTPVPEFHGKIVTILAVGIDDKHFTGDPHRNFIIYASAEYTKTDETLTRAGSGRCFPRLGSYGIS